MYFIDISKCIKRTFFSQYTYKTTNEFLDEVSKRPDIHVILEEFSYALLIIICVYACQYKGTVHDQHREERHLEIKNLHKKWKKYI